MGIFILIFVAYWLSESVKYFFFDNSSEIVVNFIVISFIAIVIVAIFNIDNRRLVIKMQSILDKKDNDTLSATNKALAYLALPLKVRLAKTCDIIKSDLEVNDAFVTLKKDGELTIINLDDKLKELFEDSKVKQWKNSNEIKDMIATAYINKEYSIKYQKLKKTLKIDESNIFEVLNIPLSTPYCNQNLGVLTILTSKLPNKTKEVILGTLTVIGDNIAFNIYLDKQKGDIRNLVRSNNLESELASSSVLLDNYTTISSKLNLELKRSYRYKNKFSAILLDIEKKSENDIVISDDECLKLEVSVINVIKNMIRDIDVFGLWKNNKFVILLPETDMVGASILANRLKKRILHTIDMGDDHCHFGISQFNIKEEDAFMKFVLRLEKALEFANEQNTHIRAM